MQKIVLCDIRGVHAELLPITYTRTVADIRLGLDTLAAKWQALLPGEYSILPEVDYLTEFLGSVSDMVLSDPDTIFVASNIIADAALADAVGSLSHGERLVDVKGAVIAKCGDRSGYTDKIYPAEYKAIEHLYDIFMFNGEAIAGDFCRITDGRASMPLSATNTVIGDPSKIFIGQGAWVEGAFLNTSAGPIYIGKDATVMEGSMLRGPIAICEHATVNMGTKIYPGTTIGRFCKVGGELNNVVMHDYSNKAHDGFLGNAVVGSWCNIGAGAVASNLKNDYTPIRLWNYPERRFLRTGLQFCGLIMGDHSKAGINTMFNTATVLGVGVNIHGSGFPRNFVPSFSEGSTAGYTDVSMSKFFETAARMMARRSVELSDAHRRLYLAIRQAAEEFK